MRETRRIGTVTVVPLLRAALRLTPCRCENAWWLHEGCEVQQLRTSKKATEDQRYLRQRTAASVELFHLLAVALPVTTGQRNLQQTDTCRVVHSAESVPATC